MSLPHEQLEAKLIRANTLLRTVIDENPNIILMKDWDGKFLIGNRALANLYGTTPEQLVGKDDGDFNPNAEQVAFYLQNVREIMSQDATQVVMESSTNAATGETRYFQSIKKPITTEEGKKQILVIANDVTELKEAQQKLEKSERRLAYVLEATGEGIWDWDITSGEVVHNAQWCKIAGVDDGYLRHQVEQFAELIHEDDKALVFERLEKCLQGEGPYHSEHRMRLADGRVSWVLDRGNVVERDAAGKPLRMVGSFVDIDERKSMDVALALRTELLDTIFDLSPDGFVSFDAEYRVTYINPAVTRMTGIEAAVAIGSSEVRFSELLAERCQSNDKFKGIAQLRLDATQKNADVRAVVEFDFPKKRVLELVLRASRSYAVSQILYMRDITHEFEVDHMKSEFLSTAAHELRTPMASIYGFSEVLLSQPDLSDEERLEFLSTIFKQSELMVSIINELLDIARIEARRGKDFIIEPIDLTGLVKQTVAQFKFPDGRDCRVMIAPEDDAKVWVNADRKKMIQTLNNILSNAFKYSPDGGEVSLEVLSPRQMETGERVVGVRVTDQGIGMSESELKRVFERFYRADSSGKIPGTGLGMSIVKEIVELHGGKIEISSQPQVGTVVTVWLPLHSPENEWSI